MEGIVFSRTFPVLPYGVFFHSSVLNSSNATLDGTSRCFSIAASFSVLTFSISCSSSEALFIISANKSMVKGKSGRVVFTEITKLSGVFDGTIFIPFCSIICERSIPENFCVPFSIADAVIVATPGFFSVKEPPLE